MPSCRPSGSFIAAFCSWLSVFIIIPHLHHHVPDIGGCEAAPTAPDLQACHLPVSIPSAEPPLQCCPPGISASTPTPRLFRPTAPSSPLRLRRPAHLASPAYAQKLARAYALMKALPLDDPRSFSHQANIHCAYCNSAYNQLNSSQLFQVHGGWLFCPFHRWYIYFHERILAKLLGDDSFALPFWNYDHPNASSIPWLFRSYDQNLVSVFRDPLHNRPDATVSIDGPLGSDERGSEQQLLVNEFAMHRALVRDGSTWDGFFGLPLRQGDEPSPGAGSLELLPHDSVHIWLGNKTAVGLKDMGSFYGAARDPVFYSHHAELDRLWEIWKSLPGHQDIADDDYLDSEFIFYNEDAELVRVRVGDSLNISLLGYSYEEVETPWMDAVPERCSPAGKAELSTNSSICDAGEPLLVPCSVVVERPDPDAGKGNEVPGLSGTGVLDGLHLTLQVDTTRMGSSLNIYVNLPEADETTSPACMELVAPFESLTPVSAAASETYLNITATYSLYGRLVELNLTGQTSAVITLVPFFPTHSSLPAASAPLIFQSCSMYNFADTSAYSVF